MKTLLETVSKSDVFTDPFPHIVIQNALDDDLCMQLINEFPSIDTITEGQAFSHNDRFSYSAKDVLQNPAITPLWKEFIQAQSSDLFWRQFLNLFKDDVQQLHPSFERDFGRLDELQPGIRKADDRADLMLDAQICINAPVLTPSPVIKQAHVDRPRVVFAGLYYLRHPEDESTGGNLEIYRFKSGTPYGFKGQYIDDKYMELVKTVKYERNTLVLFANSVHSLHGVTVRSVTPMPRCFVNLVGEVKRPIYDLGRYQEAEDWMSKISRQFAKIPAIF